MCIKFVLRIIKNILQEKYKQEYLDNIKFEIIYYTKYTYYKCKEVCI